MNMSQTHVTRTEKKIKKKKKKKKNLFKVTVVITDIRAHKSRKHAENTKKYIKYTY